MDDRQKYWFGIATSMELTSKSGDTHKLYQIIQQFSVLSLSSLRSVVRPPPEGEVIDAIQRLYKNKVSGEDGFPAEIYKSCVDTRTLAP
ncbi:unnamed protein product [Schistocephalus solidus]|uniref:Rab-GAP TBC domain-containing protein n=1 Tax=Schistocephalus solidus TaxID=70667 RepID=A0A183THG2_SCHSO|nr:unnamed protein product [Schistocephalus solidus]